MDINELVTYLLSPMAQVALIIGIAEIIKRMGMATKFIPLVDLGLGLISGIGVYTMSMGYSLTSGVLIGIALGLSACGLFSGIKNTIGGNSDDGEI